MKRLFFNIIFLVATTLTLAAQNDFYAQLADSAFVLTRQQVIYDPAYFRISYPNGDVPADRGVCTDVVIRAYRKFGVDLQREVHEDMKAHFTLYPKIWGMKTTDTNIDHRRVPNLMTFFSRFGTIKKNSAEASDYSAGDIVCWDLGGGLKHIGIVSNRKSPNGQRLLIIHNIGAGQVLEDILFQFKIIGHYQYKKEKNTAMEQQFFYGESDYLTYKTCGSGKTVIVGLHGIASSKDSWNEILPYFDKNKFTFYLLDLKGFGNSSMPKDNQYSLKSQAAIVADFINKNIDDDYFLMGHSMGGGICMWLLTSDLLALQPRAQILIDAASYKENVASFVWLMRSRWLNCLAFNLTSAKMRTKSSLKLVTYKGNLTPQITERYVTLGKNRRQYYSLACATQQFIPPREEYEQQVAKYAEITLPVLIIWGKNDRTISVKNGEKLHSVIPNSQLAVLDSCGHLTHEEKPQEVFFIIDEFLKSKI